MRNFVTAFLASLLVAASALPAASADMVVGVYAAQPDACGDTRILNKISHRFDHQVRNVPNLPLVEIDDFFQLGVVRYQPARDDRPIERRYCHGKVALSSGHSRDIWYLIETPMGFAGRGSNVEFCVSGFDRWYVYGGRCRVLR